MVHLSRQVKRDLAKEHVDVCVSFGGYSSAPVTMAARKLGVPIVIHEQNSIPGRSNVVASRSAYAIATVFESTADSFPDKMVVRTGMPIRRELGVGHQGVLPFGQQMDTGRPTLLVMGGSQGSVALNDIALSTAQRLEDKSIQWIHSTGVDHYDKMLSSLEKLPVKGSYVIRAFLEAKDLGAVLHNTTLAISRSGSGAISEFAAFRKPAIFIPLPTSYKNHQMENAREMERLGAATVIPQDEFNSHLLERAIMGWLDDKERYEQAVRGLAEWDRPDASARVLELALEAVRS